MTGVEGPRLPEQRILNGIAPVVAGQQAFSRALSADGAVETGKAEIWR